MEHETQQHGFSLIELMIALLLGLIVMAAVIEVFLSSRQMYRVQDAKAHIQENGRYAMHVLAERLRDIGYQGCGSLQVSDADITNTLNNPNDYLWNFSVPIQGAEATSTTAWTPALDASISSAVGGSDVLTLRGPTQPEIRITAHPGGTPPGSADIQVNTNNKLERFDIVMVTDCESAAIFEITAGNPDTSGSLPHNTGAVTEGPGNATKALGKNYNGGWISRMLTTSYYIAPNPDGVPALYAKQADDAAEEIVSGIERMQIDYGVDNNADGSADVYQTADSVANWENVVSVNIQLVSVSGEDNLTVDGPQIYFLNGANVTPGDRRLRSVFSRTITLRNRVP